MFVSCEKENLINKTNDKILKFNSIEELNKHIDKTLKMNHNELKDLEESRGFKSFGRSLSNNGINASMLCNSQLF